MLSKNQNPFNKSIVVAVLGVPNAGKSTLINKLLGHDLAAVTAFPQTTRNAYHCCFTVDKTEVVLVDTPGLHANTLEINKRMNHAANEWTQKPDLQLLVIDMAKPIGRQIDQIKKLYKNSWQRIWVAFNKWDLLPEVSDGEINQMVNKIKSDYFPSLERHFVVSAKCEHNISSLTEAFKECAPQRPHRYPDGPMSNKNMRFFSMEYIREKAFELLKDEVPYELAVVIDEYKEEGSEKDKARPKVSRISASILVNRPGQRAIVVGKGGQVIKEIGTQARKKIEALAGGKVHLNLHVKVAPKWFKNNRLLEELGLPRSPDSARVWRARP